jgi:hypothetical protein
MIFFHETLFSWSYCFVNAFYTSLLIFDIFIFKKNPQKKSFLPQVGGVEVIPRLLGVSLFLFFIFKFFSNLIISKLNSYSLIVGNFFLIFGFASSIPFWGYIFLFFVKVLFMSGDTCLHDDVCDCRHFKSHFTQLMDSVVSWNLWKSEIEAAKIPKVHEPYVIVSPLETLSKDESNLLVELRKISEKWTNEFSEEDMKFLTDETLFRYLKGKKWVLEDANKQLYETVQWRSEFKPLNLKMDKKISSQRYMFHRGFDRKFRPICYILLGRDTIENTVENQNLKFNHLVHTMESCIQVMKPGVTNTCFVIDLKNANISLNLINQMKDMFSKLGGYYTERLGICLITNCSFSMSFLWEVVKNFLPKETLSKYIFISASEKTEMLEEFEDFIDKKELIGYFHGDLLEE